MERKVIKFEIKDIDEETGIIEGYGATFSKDPDSYGDIIDPGAFTKTLKENAGSIVSLFNHSIMEPIGLPELTEDSKGLYAKIRLVMDIQKAKDTLALAKAGVITRMSIGFETIKSDYIKSVRHLKEIRLFDVSPVIFAANPEAVIVSVKDISAMTDRDLNAIEKAALVEMKRRVSGEEGTPGLELKPYLNEHACRLRDPDDFQDDSFRRVTRESDGKKYSVIRGKLKGEDTMIDQAYRYHKDTWDADDARSHCERHDGSFEAAKKQEGSDGALSTATISEIRAAFQALHALLETAEGKLEPELSTPTPSDESYEAASLDAVIAGLKAENEGFDTAEAEARIEGILAQLRQ